MARHSDLVTTALSASGVRVLLRLCSDGLLEAVSFCRPLRESGFVQVGDIREGTTLFVTYRKFDDLVCGKSDTGTRVLDLSRISVWGRIVGLIERNRPQCARDLFHTWFEHQVNPLFDVPYPLFADPTPKHTLPPTHEALLRGILVVAAPAHPSSIQIAFPATSAGRARITPGSLKTGETTLAPHLKRNIESLCGLVVYDIAGSGLFINEDADANPLQAHTLSDIALQHAICIATHGDASAHQLIAARAALTLYWDRAKNDNDLATKLQVVARGAALRDFQETIDSWIRS